ncbi:MAG: Gfo/Idh/MocA family oxidoreductase [Bryobacteraceae bacterium]|nr:Gfo/Idh/MocA family oxidoreductase [Bryobacteraceae bacterium]
MRIPALVALSALPLAAADLRLGIVGTDTSHVIAFTTILNDPSHRDHVPGARVVAAFRGGSPDLPASRDRVDKYASELQAKFGVEIVPDIPTLLGKVDAVLLESVDGRVHLAQFREIARAGKPVFIDKPLASTLEDAREIAALARRFGVPWFSSSALRYSSLLPGLKGDRVDGALVWGPGPLEPTHQLDLSWYGIHAVEILYALMGPGCEEVSRLFAEDAEVVSARWKDGRVAAIRLARPYSGYGAVVFAGKEIRQAPQDLYTGYRGLVERIVEFFRTRVPPVPEQETLEMFSFMDAAQRSRAAAGAPVKLR